MFKIGDVARIKTRKEIEAYPRDDDNERWYQVGNNVFGGSMFRFCGKLARVTEVFQDGSFKLRFPWNDLDYMDFVFTPEMVRKARVTLDDGEEE